MYSKHRSALGLVYLRSIVCVTAWHCVVQNTVLFRYYSLGGDIARDGLHARLRHVGLLLVLTLLFWNNLKKILNLCSPFHFSTICRRMGMDNYAYIRFSIAKGTLPWEPILGLSQQKCLIPPSFIALAFRMDCRTTRGGSNGSKPPSQRSAHSTFHPTEIFRECNWTSAMAI